MKSNIWIPLANQLDGVVVIQPSIHLYQELQNCKRVGSDTFVCVQYYLLARPGIWWGKLWNTQGKYYELFQIIFANSKNIFCHVWVWKTPLVLIGIFKGAVFLRDIIHYHDPSKQSWALSSLWQLSKHSYSQIHFANLWFSVF